MNQPNKQTTPRLPQSTARPAKPTISGSWRTWRIWRWPLAKHRTKSTSLSKGPKWESLRCPRTRANGLA
eukprot:1198999-Prorocentrum_lima.AAC.1